MTIFMVHNMAYWHDWVSRNQASSLHTYVVNDILRHACTWSTAALIAAWLSTLFFLTLTARDFNSCNILKISRYGKSSR